MSSQIEQDLMDLELKQLVELQQEKDDREFKRFLMKEYMFLGLFACAGLALGMAYSFNEWAGVIMVTTWIMFSVMIFRKVREIYQDHDTIDQ